MFEMESREYTVSHVESCEGRDRLLSSHILSVRIEFGIGEILLRTDLFG
jgi:hypothetical protein